MEAKARVGFPAGVERQHLVPPYPPLPLSLFTVHLLPRRCRFYPCPVSLSVSLFPLPSSAALPPSHPLSLSPTVVHPREPISLPPAGVHPSSSVARPVLAAPFRPLPLSRRYFRDDELQYAPIVAAGNQRAYPKSSMVSTHPTQPKPSLAKPGTRPTRTHVRRARTHTRKTRSSCRSTVKRTPGYTAAIAVAADGVWVLRAHIAAA